MKTLLLIEDDAVLRENTAEILELADYKVITAPNGKVGLDRAIEYMPDIIVCDIMMPELDGYAVLEILSKNRKTKCIPFIFLSAKTEKNDVREGMNMGADDYITKPFSEDELICAIESRLAKAAILNDERKMLKSLNKKHRSNDRFQSLNDLKNFFEDRGAAFSFNEDSVVYREGDHANFMYLIAKGAVKCYKIDEQGKELTTALYREDDFFGYTSFTKNIPHQEAAKAIKDLKLYAIHKSELKNILNNNHKVTLELIQLLSDDLIEVKNHLLQMAYGSVNKKTAATLIQFSEKLNRKTEDPIKISRNDLASVAGVATETLIRTMSNFKKQGLIEMEGRNIRILDLKKLQLLC